MPRAVVAPLAGNSDLVGVVDLGVARRLGAERKDGSTAAVLLRHSQNCIPEA